MTFEEKEKIDDRIIVNIKITGDGQGKTYTLKKLRQLLQANGFQFQDIKHEHGFIATCNGYHDKCNPIEEFIKTHIRPNPEGIMTKEHVYGKYREYCINQGISFLNLSAFSRAFISAATTSLPNMIETRRNIDGTRIRCWAGIIDKTDH